MKTKCYIARYPLDESGNNLKEEILFEDTFASEFILGKWKDLIETRNSNDPMLQMWYSGYTVECIYSTNQPFKLS